MLNYPVSDLKFTISTHFYVNLLWGWYFLILLIVEDDRDTSEGICEYFRESGYEVTAAYDGEEALILARSNVYDLILLDIMLPKTTGLTVLYELRKTSDVPVIMLTAIGDEHTQIASFDGLADDYVTKPFSILLLEKRINALLRRKQSKNNSFIWQYKNITVPSCLHFIQGKSSRNSLL